MNIYFLRPNFYLCCLVPMLAACICFLGLWSREVRAAESASGDYVLQQLRSFQQMGSVLYIAAHPDDENTQLLAYLALGRRYRTAYLSLTRGDGGQNVLGPELDELLGVARTQELLAARGLDGARQFFTRAIDFGFSKNSRETLQVWNRKEVVEDIVRIIREFRPDVVITRFSPEMGGHGHHTASAVLAIEAFPLAGDPNAFPEMNQELPPWQPKRLFWNGMWRGTDAPPAGILRLETDGTHPVTGATFAEIAAKSRNMHKTQGFGSYSGPPPGARVPRVDSFQLLAGEPAAQDIMDGVDTTWARVSGGAEIGRLTEEAIQRWDGKALSASVPALLNIRKRLVALPKDRITDEKLLLLDRTLQLCLGLTVETTIPRAEVLPGEVLPMRHRAKMQAGLPVTWLGVRYPAIRRQVDQEIVLSSERPVERDISEKIPVSAPLSHPYWLRLRPNTGMFHVADRSLIGQAENPPAFPIEHIFQVGDQIVTIPDEPVQVVSDAGQPAEAHRRLDIVAPVSLRFLSDVAVFAPGSKRRVEIEVTALRPDISGPLKMDVPSGWRVTPASHSVRMASIRQQERFSFTVTAPKTPGTADLFASVAIDGVTCDRQRVEIRYGHIPLQLLQTPVSLKAISLDLAIRGKRIGYLMGAGDSVDECLEQMGYSVTQLTGADLTKEKLHRLDAVIIGIRAYNVRTDLASGMSALFAYARKGGTVIVQYNRPNDLKINTLAPYTLQLSQDRVTEENAAVTFLAPDHPVLHSPNQITQADFQGWVQERGSYFPRQWGQEFTPILACGDTGETPLQGGLLVAHHGKGYFVYTGLAWFRQLPAGVPGAYRLFANLVSLGK